MGGHVGILASVANRSHDIQQVAAHGSMRGDPRNQFALSALVAHGFGVRPMRLAFYAVGFVLFVAAVAMVAQRHGGDGAGSTIAQGAANMAPKVSLGGK